MNISSYLESLNNRYKSGISREHSYRGDLEQLIRTIVPEINVTNEPANVTDCGNPDYVISKGKIPVGYIEAKDIGKDLNSKSYKEQFTRYKNALDNLIITDYLWFQFFQNGELVFETKIAEVSESGVTPLPENFTALENQLKDFCTFIGVTIKSSQKLAKMMATKARLFQDVLEKATACDEEKDENTSLKEQYQGFKDILIHDITPKDFADLYAQTLAYGMFAARLQDETLEDFSRQEAADLIPKSNPFLRKLFQYIAGYDIDERIEPTVNNLADVFRHTNLRILLKDFGKSTQQNDPIVHFYETFLEEYDYKLKKDRGVWYTPQPIVQFMVRAVDDILKTEFGLTDGLADTSKTKIRVKTDIANQNFKSGYKEVEKEVHRVQILDPATGTGTFLAEVIKYIYEGKFKAMQGIWSSYVEDDLIPRLNGFELLMASYAMAHLKLDLLLRETGYKPTKDQRFKVYLTNSLEEHNKDTGTLFANWLSTEANAANYIKRDTPVMCVIGNPPYAVSSSNKNDWIQDLISDYKKNLNERKINLDDDYIKFIRYGQHYIDKNGEGILAYISNNSFIDGITHRQMRKNLLETFDKIYILDLHGNSKRKEVCPDGSPDQNVFDIMQGVSINIFVKSGNKKANQLGKVFHSDLYGKRSVKYPFLFENTVSTIKWEVLENKKPYLFFVPKDFKEGEKYNEGFKVNELFLKNVSGIETMKDSLVIYFDKNEFELIKNKIDDREYIKKKAGKIREEQITRFQNAIINEEYIISKILYRAFDKRVVLYWPKDNKGVMWRNRGEVMNQMNYENIGISFSRTVYGNYDWQDVQVINSIAEKGFMAMRVSNAAIICPLYLYSEKNNQQTIEKSARRTPNLNQEIITKIASMLGLTFTNEKEETNNNFAPIDVLDYIYAVLHSPTYREKYQEILKIDFPRVPYPKDKKTFWNLVKLGGEIRQIHLLESSKVEDYIATYPKGGDNTITTKVGKKDWELFNEEKQLGRIWINEEQYFDNIPLTAWEFYIGGYQPAQRWLKERKERELKFEDILHYQKIIVALTETDRLMKEIDEIEIE
jgi:predicted helicase